jgi:hypothetical protein
MRRHAALIVLLAAHALVAGLALLFYLHLRVAVAEAFSDFNTTVPTLTLIALSDTFLPAAVGAGLSLAACGLTVPLKRSQRAALLGGGLCVSSFALIFAAIAAYLPFFQPASF